MISILYVDDETALLDITKLYLERTGEFSVETCAAAREALGILEQTTYDAVVSDYQMPDMDGLAFLKALRERDPALPFILFTGRGREEVAIEALNSGADFYLQKGGEPKSQFAELANKVRHAVKRRQAEQALQTSEERFRGIFDNAPVGIFHTTPDGHLSDVNPVFARMFGFESPEAMIAEVNGTASIGQYYAEPGQRQAIVQEVLGSDAWHSYDVPFLRRDGSTFRTLMSIRSYIPASGASRQLEGFIVDLTEKQRAETQIRASERRYHNLFDAVGDALLVLDHATGSILDANPTATEMFGYEREEFRGMRYQDLGAGPGGTEPPETCGVSTACPQIAYRKRDGTVFTAEITASQYPQKSRTISIVSIRDITDRKRVEERLITARRLYAVLSEINQTIVRVHDLETLLADICRIAVEFGKFRMVWIGFVNQDSQALRPVAYYGIEEGYLSNVEISSAGGELGDSPAGCAIRQGEHDICNDIATDPRMQPWRMEALSRGYRSSASFPIRLHGSVIGALSIYAGEPEYFNETEIRLIDEIAMDVSFALDMLDEQARRMRAEKDLAGSEERAQFLAEVLDTSSQPFGILYPDGSIGVVNPALCDLLGYPEEELRQLNWKDILSPEFVDLSRRIIRELEDTGIPQRVEAACIRKDGKTIPVELFLHLAVDPGRNIRHFSVFITGISARQEAEESLRAERDLARQYLDTAGVLISAIDCNGTITMINRTGCDLLGYSEEELIGKCWVDLLVPPDAREEVRDALTGMMNGECGAFVYHENTVVTKGGEIRLFAFQNTLLSGRAPSAISGLLFSAQDITDQRRMEASLRQSDERFRNLIQKSADMIRILDREGRIVYSSPSTAAITGYDPEDVLGSNAFDFVHPDDAGRMRAAFGEVLAGMHVGHPTAYRIQHADGGYVDVEAIGLNLLGTPGIDGIVTITRPGAERKAADVRLHACEEQYTAVLESSFDAVFICGDAIQAQNSRAAQMFGYAPEELAGHTPDTILLAREDEDGAAAIDLSRLLEVPVGTTRLVPARGRRKDGTLFLADVSVRPVPVQGEPVRVLLVHEVPVYPFPGDEHPDPVIECTAAGEIATANAAAHAALHVWGMPDTPAAFLPPDIDAVLEGFVRDGTGDVSREVRVGPGWYSETIRPLAGNGGCRIFARDITDHVMAVQALEQANRKVNLFASLNRHDIRNRLTSLISYLALAGTLAEDEKQHGYLGQADMTAERIRQLVERPEGVTDLGAHAPRWQQVSEIVASEVRLLHRSDITVQNETGGLWIYADPMLSQVIGELMANSLQHGGQVTRMGFFVRESRDFCTLFFEDDGAGIPAEKKEALFTPSERTAEGDPRARFGLPLIRDILLFTGITITETGEPELGARFELVIPRGKFRLSAPE